MKVSIALLLASFLVERVLDLSPRVRDVNEMTAVGIAALLSPINVISIEVVVICRSDARITRLAHRIIEVRVVAALIPSAAVIVVYWSLLLLLDTCQYFPDPVVHEGLQ